MIFGHAGRVVASIRGGIRQLIRDAEGSVLKGTTVGDSDEVDDVQSSRSEEDAHSPRGIRSRNLNKGGDARIDNEVVMMRRLIGRIMVVVSWRW